MTKQTVYNPETNDVIEIDVEDEVVDLNDFVMVVDDEMKKQMDRQTKEANLKSSMFLRWEKNISEMHLRILPGRRSWGGSPFMPAIQHWVTKENNKRAPVRCLAPLGSGCPLCDLANELRHHLPPDEAQKYEAQTQFLYNVIDINDKPTDGIPKVKVFGAPKGVHEAIQINLNSGWDLLGTHGYPMKFVRTTQSGNTRYSGGPIPTRFTVDTKLLGGIHNLQELANPVFTLSESLKLAQATRIQLGLIQPGGAQAALPAMQRKVTPANLNKLNKEL